MKRVIIALSLIGSMALMADTQADNQEVVKEGLKYIKMLGKELKSNVQAKMKEDKSGVLAAQFCAQNAENITNKLDAKFPKGVRVYRTSLRVRNPKNAPDKIDAKVLEELNKEVAKKGYHKKPIVVDLGDKKRVYVPLITENVCLKCHGNIDKINPEIKKSLAKKYPNDKAFNFKAGDLRGVIVAELPAKK